jgi:hypothetical protein
MLVNNVLRVVASAHTTSRAGVRTQRKDGKMTTTRTSARRWSIAALTALMGLAATAFAHAGFSGAPSSAAADSLSMVELLGEESTSTPVTLTALRGDADTTTDTVEIADFGSTWS